MMLKGDENMKKKWDLKINKYVVFDYNEPVRVRIWLIAKDKLGVYLMPFGNILLRWHANVSVTS
jgi:hypothetical protein